MDCAHTMLTRPWMLRMLPMLRWWPMVDRRSLRADLLAGLTGAVILVPQAVAYASIAGLPPEYGLYTAIVPVIVAALFGSSWHLVSGPTAAISIVVFATLSPLAEPGSAAYIGLVLTLTFMVGVLTLLMGLARLGSLVTFVSQSVVVGFTAGAAMLIATSQLKNFFGLTLAAGGRFLDTLGNFVRQVGDLDPYVTSVGMAVGEAGSLMYMDAGIGMDTVFGDGSGQQGGLLGKLLGAGKRLVTGESLFTTVYTNTANRKLRVAFAAPYPGKILAMDLRRFGGTLICQKDAFLCAARGVSLGIALQRKLSVGFFGGEGFIMQKLEGDGLAFVHAGGTLLERELKPGETLMIDTGCIVAYTLGIDFEIQYVGKIKTALFGGEGLFFAKVTGPGHVWLQSLPFSRLASRVFAAAPQRGGSREEGSILGGFGAGGLLGGVLGGDDE
jgi:uncharacterized protein (AIM24 family)